MQNRLRELRLRRGLTLESLARKAGLTLTGYHRIETGKVDPKLGNAQAIAVALGATVEEIWPPESVVEQV